MSATDSLTDMVDSDEWDQIIDRAARFHLGMSGEEFRRRHEDGEYEDPDNGPSGLMAVLTLLPTSA